MDKQKIMPVATLASVSIFGIIASAATNWDFNAGLGISAGMTVIGFCWAKMQEVGNDR